MVIATLSLHQSLLNLHVLLLKFIPNLSVLQTFCAGLTLQPSIIQQLPLPSPYFQHPSPQFFILSTYLLNLLLLDKNIRDDFLAFVVIDLVEVLLKTCVGFSLVVD